MQAEEHAVDLQNKIAALLLQNETLKSYVYEIEKQKHSLSDENKVLHIANAELSKRNENLKSQNEWFQRQLFGRKSERRLAEVSHHQLWLGELLEVEDTPPPMGESIAGYQRRQRRKQPMEGSVLEEGLRFDSRVPVEEIEVKNPELEKLDVSQYDIVSEKVTYRLAQRPGSYVVLKYIRKVAKLKESKDLVCAPAPMGVFEKSYGDVSFLSGLLIDKFAYHLPLYRQHQRLVNAGVMMSRATLTNFVHRSVDLLEPIYYAMLSSILQSEVLLMDETPIKADRMKGKMKTGYFWPLLGDQHEIAFIFANTRASPVVKEVLGTYCNTLVSDGYRAYEIYAQKTDALTHAQCWVHVRRKFVEAEKHMPDLSTKMLDFISDLYQQEKTILENNLSGQSKQDHRQNHSKPIVDLFFSELKSAFDSHVLLPSNPWTKAANYALKREEQLKVFLDHPNVPMDTNAIERHIRPIAIGRKNWLFCWTEVGAKYAGIAHSLIASCKMHKIDPYVYLVDVLQRVATHPAQQVHLLTPRLWKVHFEKNPLTSDLSTF